ncbi:helix-turn-helix transcriptional regulator [Neobacillus sp. 3P2-tot-E-2]|uniref:helix-turn-helix transcriptional regulator n=1 Tax=Neobacillus sp. 3P2-tot-E-2 TaxID=3132212 RepID=UPI0039A1363D
MSPIKKLRFFAELSQGSLASRLGISQSYLSYLERGKRPITPEISKKIEEVFGFSIKFID